MIGKRDLGHPKSRSVETSQMKQLLYGTVRWKQKRLRQLQKEPLCRYCLAQGYTTAANVADHIVPHRGDANLFWKGELQSLCFNHHSGAKQGEEAGGGRKRMLIGLDGYPVVGE